MILTNYEYIDNAIRRYTNINIQQVIKSHIHVFLVSFEKKTILTKSFATRAYHTSK